MITATVHFPRGLVGHFFCRRQTSALTRVYCKEVFTAETRGSQSSECIFDQELSTPRSRRLRGDIRTFIYLRDTEAPEGLHARSFSLGSSPHDLNCQPNGDDCDRYSPKQIRHLDHLLYNSSRLITSTTRAMTNRILDEATQRV
jgi:hypothetical protein